MKSALGFFLALLAGLAVGLAYGWLANPASYSNTTPDTLRMDYQTDYVLMVAEAFQAEPDPGLAASRLAFLGTEQAPVQRVQQAVLEARRIGYTPDDLKRMTDLAAALQSWAPASEKTAP